jgi:hypothetical protein
MNRQTTGVSQAQMRYTTTADLQAIPPEDVLIDFETFGGALSTPFDETKKNTLGSPLQQNRPRSSV